MKNLKKIGAFVVFLSTLSIFLPYSAGWFIISTPQIHTDKYNYFPNENIQINSSWEVYFTAEEELEILIFILDYNPLSKGLSFSIDDAISRNQTIDCPKMQCANLLFNFSVSDLEFSDGQQFWVNLAFLDYQNGELREFESHLFSVTIEISKFSIATEYTFNQSYQMDHTENYLLQNSIFASENSKIKCFNHHYEFQIFNDTNLIYNFNNDTSNFGLFYLNFSSYALNLTGNFSCELIFEENLNFKAKSFFFNLIINKKQLKLQLFSGFIQECNLQSEEIQITVGILNEFDEISNIDVTDWNITSELNFSNWVREENLYIISFENPKVSTNFSLIIEANKENFDMIPINSSISILPKQLDLHLRIRDIKINESFSFYIETNSSINFDQLILDNLFTQINCLGDYVSLEFEILHIYTNLIIISINWEEIYSRFLNNETIDPFHFRISYFSDPRIQDCHSNILIVNQPPRLNFSTNGTIIIQEQSIQFSFTGYSGSFPVSYLWTFGDGANSTFLNPIHTYSDVGSYSIRLQIQDSEENIFILNAVNYIQVIGEILPEALFTIDSTSNITNEIIHFIFSGIEGNLNTSFYWDFGDGQNSTQRNPNHSFSSAGIYTITLYIEDIDHDKDSYNYSIEIFWDLFPSISFSYSANHIVLGESIDFFFTGSEGNGPASFYWTFGDNHTSTARNPVYTFTNYGIFSISLTVTDFDGDQVNYNESNLVTVEKDIEPLGNITINRYNLILGQEINCNYSGIQGNLPTQYTWIFGDGNTSNLLAPTYIYQMPGTYIIQLELIDKDGDFLTLQSSPITVIQDKIPNGTIDLINLSVIQGEQVTIDFSGSYGNEPSQFSWKIENTTFYNESQISYIFYNIGKIPVNISISDKDGDIFITSVIITVWEDLIPSALVLPNKSETIAGESVQFYFNGTEGNNPATFHWDFGDGSFSNEKNPCYIFQNPGDYTIVLNVTDIDGDSDIHAMTYPIIVHEDLFPNISIHYNTSEIIAGDYICFNYTGSFGNREAKISWRINESITIAAENVLFKFYEPGIYSIYVKIIDLDGDMEEKTYKDLILVKKELFPQIYFKSNASTIIQNQNVEFIFTGDYGNEPSSIFWYFGDGKSSSNENPVHTFENSGNFTISIVIIDSNFDVIAENYTNFIKVLPDVEPVSHFIYIFKEEPPQHNLSFIFDGINGNEPCVYIWEFSNGEIYYGKNITITNIEDSQFSVNLTIIDADGDVSSYSQHLNLSSKVFTVPRILLASSGLIGLTTCGTIFGKKYLKNKSRLISLNKIKI